MPLCVSENQKNWEFKKNIIYYSTEIEKPFDARSALNFLDGTKNKTEKMLVIRCFTSRGRGLIYGLIGNVAKRSPGFVSVASGAVEKAKRKHDRFKGEIAMKIGVCFVDEKDERGQYIALGILNHRLVAFNPSAARVNILKKVGVVGRRGKGTTRWE
jgi:hypothetical protein